MFEYEKPTWEQDIEEDENDDDDHGNIHSLSVSMSAQTYAAQHIIILIDTNPSMFKRCIRMNSLKDGDESERESALTTPIDAALMAAERLLHHKVNTVATSKINKRDGVGVILYGAPVREYVHNNHGDNNNINDNSDNPIHFNENGDDMEGAQSVDSDDDDESTVMERPHVNQTVKTLVELSPPGVDQIKTLRSYLPPQFFDKKKRNNGDFSSSNIHRIIMNNQNGANADGINDLSNDFIREMNDEIDFTPRERDLQMELFGSAGNTGKNQNIKEEEEDISRRCTDNITGGQEQMVISSNNNENLDDGDDDDLEYCTLRPALHEAHRAFTNAK